MNYNSGSGLVVWSKNFTKQVLLLGIEPKKEPDYKSGLKVESTSFPYTTNDVCSLSLNWQDWPHQQLIRYYRPIERTFSDYYWVFKWQDKYDFPPFFSMTSGMPLCQSVKCQIGIKPSLVWTYQELNNIVLTSLEYMEKNTHSN